MKRFLGYLILLLLLSIYIVSLDNELTNKITEKRALLKNPFFAADAHNYGDLYTLSLLPDYRIPVTHTSNIPLIKCNVKPITNLYTLCDSYIWEFVADKKYYCGVNNFRWINTAGREKLNIKPDSEKNNVFLFEIAERQVRETLNDTAYLNNFFVPEDNKNLTNNELSIFSKARTLVFNHSINTNLELNIWDTQLFSSIKGFKYYLNYKLFNMLDKSVTVSPDKKRLLFTPTIDTMQTKSAFKHIPDQEIASIIETLNRMYYNAKKSGFDEVYLSIIPSPVSILYPHYNGFKYNNLIKRIQRSPNLKIKVIDTYAAFKKSNIPMYSLSDSHWNMDGSYMWLNLFNSELMQQSVKWADSK